MKACHDAIVKVQVWNAYVMESLTLPKILNQSAQIIDNNVMKCEIYDLRSFR